MFLLLLPFSVQLQQKSDSCLHSLLASDTDYRIFNMSIHHTCDLFACIMLLYTQGTLVYSFIWRTEAQSAHNLTPEKSQGATPSMQQSPIHHSFDEHSWQCLTLAFETTDSLCLAGVHDVQQQQQHWLCREQGQQPPHIQDQFCSVYPITFKVTNVCHRVSGQSFQSTKAPTLNSEFTNNLSSLTMMP